jgi:hypothetical protein
MKDGYSSTGECEISVHAHVQHSNIETNRDKRSLASANQCENRIGNE